ncbi:MAG TPA: TonB family protein [Methyloversatilis sp.]
MSRPKLHFALALSASLHALLLLWPQHTDETPPAEPVRLQARLRPPEIPAVVPEDPPPAETLLKDTRETRADPGRRTTAALDSSRPASTRRAREQAQRQLNRHVFYPPEAVAQGLEGEVKLRLLLDPAGRVIEAAIMSGSGHRILDQAALDAARQIGRIDAGGARELLLPVAFRLE